ncbi:hypothetical protein CHS0354_004554 [Potamilus streckersoni]|uniref:Uncharacterized protein n=1 Tax=Potamilus streckersoni TaxID=2493646 RepID=A0AAE0S5B5_9BIVA|nr:hypothetical protein CHS0354_004554 [Potamilus streckersoni]
MCGYVPALEQNLSCLNNLENSTTFIICLTPAYYGSQSGMESSCRYEFASAVCSMTDVETMCPDVIDAYQGALQVYPNPYCHIDLCLITYGNCGGKFRRDMPIEAVQSTAVDFVSYLHGIQYICGSGRSYVECMVNGSLCTNFNILMTFKDMFGIQLKPASYLVDQGCKDIDTLTSKFWCLNEQFASRIFEECISLVLAKSSSAPETPYDVMPCSVYHGITDCMNSIIAEKCGQEVVDYYVKWSPAVFLLVEGCDSWEASSASSMEKITTLMLIQLSIALQFFFKK